MEDPGGGIAGAPAAGALAHDEGEIEPDGDDLEGERGGSGPGHAAEAVWVAVEKVFPGHGAITLPQGTGAWRGVEVTVQGL